MARSTLASIVLCTIVFTSAAPHADEDRVLAQLKSANVDWLSFGMASLEAELRLDDLEICRVADCSLLETEISVAYTDDVPQGWPSQTFPWPSGGVIVVVKKINRTGVDSSNATEDGCKTSLDSLQRDTDDAPWTSYARFFLPRDAWAGFYRNSRNADTIERLLAIESHIFAVVTEKHEWRRPNGRIDRSVWVTCVGSAARSGQGDEGKTVVIARGQIPS
jgi:hypothetical protein